VSFLRRLFGGGADDDEEVATSPPATPAEIEAAELEHERELLRAEAERLDDLAARGYANERLDQLVVDVLLGVR
jgi:xylose isomerase